MAQIPSEADIKLAQQETLKKIRDKRSKQKAQGKEFVIDSHSGGVIPEKIWKEQKAS